MVLAIHGEAGGWDELIIAVVALAVLWVAVKLAGRKPADDGEEDEADAAATGRASTGEASTTSLDASTEAVNGSPRTVKEHQSGTRSAESRDPAQPPANRLG